MTFLTESMFAQMHRDYHAAVLRRASFIMENDFDGEDAAQSAWMDAWKSRASFDGSRSFGSWIMTILRRACWRMMQARSNRVQTVQLDEGLHDSPVDIDMDRALDVASLPDAIDTLQIPHGRRLGGMVDASDAMKETVRMTLVGMDGREIARLRGVGHQAVYKTLQGAIAALRLKWSVTA